MRLQTLFEAKRLAALTPDLRFTRERMRQDTLVEWLLAPSPPMPPTGLTRAQATDVARYILDAPLTPQTEPAPVAVPALLDRPVGYEEVAAKVLQASCWHCHADPDFARGDGGPGNTGGFGFAPRGLVLADLRGVRSGYIGDDGQRHSIVSVPVGAAGESVLVASLLARHHEVAGHPVPGLTGMPLGLPPLPLDDIALVRTWVAQGAKWRAATQPTTPPSGQAKKPRR